MNIKNSLLCAATVLSIVTAPPVALANGLDSSPQTINNSNSASMSLSYEVVDDSYITRVENNTKNSGDDGSLKDIKTGDNFSILPIIAIATMGGGVILMSGYDRRYDDLMQADA